MKKHFPVLLILILLGSSTPVVAQQKVIVENNQTWLAVFNQARFSKRWGLWHDTHFRMKDDFVGAPSLYLTRIAPVFYINDDVRIAAGYGFINSFPDGARTVSQPEHRPWQQIQWFTRYPKVRLTQWIRLEERFRRKVVNNTSLGDTYDSNGRIRYNFLFATPLSKKGFGKGGLQLLLNDEVHVNFGKNIVYNTFDQNRFFVGLGYQINSMASLQFGYMNIYVQQASGNQYRSLHAARLFYLHNFDFRPKVEEKK